MPDHEHGDVGGEGGEAEGDAGDDAAGDTDRPAAVLIHQAADDWTWVHLLYIVLYCTL